MEGEVVAVDVNTSEYLAINRSGAVIWRALERGATPAELADRLVAGFDVDRNVAVRDVEGFLATLDARGFLVVDTCECVLLSDHDDGCVCGHDIERRVYRVDDDGREHYATRPLGGRTR